MLAPELLGVVGPSPARDIAEDPPLRPRLADARARDLGAERDSPFRGGRRAAALLFVTRRRRQEHDDLAGFDEHLVREANVLVHAQRRARERGTREVGRGQHVEEVAAARPQHVELAAARGVDHLRRGQTGRGRDVEAPLRREGGGVVVASTGTPPGNAVA